MLLWTNRNNFFIATVHLNKELSAVADLEFPFQDIASL